MPITVKNLFAQANITTFSSVRWGERIQCNSSGVYIVAVSDDADKCLNPFEEAPIDKARVAGWIARVPDLKIDGGPPTVETLSQRLSEFWIPDETVLYIGKATRLKERLRKFYRHDIGSEKDRHRGGEWLKTLDILHALNVFYASTDEIDSTPETMEQALLQAFSEQVSANSRKLGRIGMTVNRKVNRTAGAAELFPMPFANREMNSGGKKRKDHGIKGRRNRTRK